MNRIKNKRKNNKDNKNNKKNKKEKSIKNNNSKIKSKNNNKSCIEDDFDLDLSDDVDMKKNKKDKKTKTKKHHPIRNFFLILLLILIILGILFYLKVEENGGGIEGVFCTIFGQSVEDLENLDTLNILLLGISEDLDTKLTDTIIVCSYNPKEQSAYMLSIPRDTFIGKNKNNAKGADKINSLYSKKGINTLLDTVNDIVDLDIKYYAIINNNALIDLVDATRWNIF